MGADCPHEGTVDLDGIDAQFMQIGKTRIAGAKIIQVDRMPHGPQLLNFRDQL